MASAPALRMMPPPAAEVWLTRDDFTRHAKYTRHWVGKLMKAGAIQYRVTSRTMRNGRPEAEIALSSLPPKARTRYDAERARAVPAKQVTPEVVPPMLALFGQQPVPAPGALRVVTNGADAKTAAERLNLITPVLEFARNPRRYSIRLRNGRAVTSKSEMVQFVTEASGVSAATIWRWLREYEAGGEGGLLKKTRKDRGQSQWFREHPEAAAVVAFIGFGDGLVGGASVAAAHRALSAHAAALEIATPDLPDYSTVRRFLMGAPADLKVLARKGERRYGDLVMPHIERSYEDTPSNAVWIADCMKADVEVQNDLFEHLPLGAPIRLQLSAIVDYRSRYFVGTCWGTVESTIPIQAAIRNAVLAHGPAEHFYADNGKSYRSVAAGAVPGYAAATTDDALTLYEQVLDTEQRLGVLARLGMKVTHCIPRHPQSKHIERQFGTVHAQYDALWQTYTAGAPHLRPFQTERMMAVHRKALKHDRPEWSMHPLASDYISGFYAWLDWHHAQPMQGRGMDGRSPAEVFRAERNPRQQPTPSLTDLAVTFASRAERVVTRLAVEMWGDRYVPAEGDAPATATMLALSGDRDDRRRVTVLFDPLDHSAVAVADERGHILCTLVRQQLLKFAPHDPVTKQQIAAGRKAALGALRASKGKLAEIRKLGRAAGARLPLELLAETAAATAPATPDTSVIAQAKPARRLPGKSSAPLYPHDVAKEIAAMED